MRAGSDPSTTTTTVKTGRELSSVAYQGSDAVFEMMDSVEFARMTLSDRWWTEGAGRGRREPAGRRVPRLPDGAPRTGSDPDRDGDVHRGRLALDHRIVTLMILVSSGKSASRYSFPRACAIAAYGPSPRGGPSPYEA